MWLLALLPLSVTAAGTPASFDLRDVGGMNYLSPVRNHHLPLNTACASCWAVTSASVIGDRLNMLVSRAGIKGAPRIEVSAQYLLNCIPGQHHCGYPGSSSAAMKYVMAHGIPDESCAPWQNAWPDGVQICDALHTCAQMMIDPATRKPVTWPNHTHRMEPVANPRMYMIKSNIRVAPNDTEAIMQALLSGPVACGVHAEGLMGYSNGVITDPGGGLFWPLHAIVLTVCVCLCDVCSCDEIQRETPWRRGGRSRRDIGRSFRRDCGVGRRSGHPLLDRSEQLGHKVGRRRLRAHFARQQPLGHRARMPFPRHANALRQSV
jgi:hypothetical protein